MRAKNVNIQDNLYDLLQKEPNASQLINDLLREHYSSLTANSKEDLVRKQMQINSEIEIFKKEKELELNRVELEVKKIEHIELTNDQKKENEKFKREEKEMYLQEVAEVELGRRLNKFEIGEYFFELENGKTNAYLFMDKLKNIKEDQE